MSDRPTSAEMAEEINLEFQGERLHPFNFWRRQAADCIGLHLYSIPPEEREAMKEARVAYPGFFTDAFLVVFLCTQENSVSAKAQRAPDVVRQLFNQWGNSINLNVTSAAGMEAAEVFGKILEAMIKTEAKQEVAPEENELRGKGSKKKP